jgi:hypothetical protein
MAPVARRRARAPQASGWLRGRLGPISRTVEMRWPDPTTARRDSASASAGAMRLMVVRRLPMTSSYRATAPLAIGPRHRSPPPRLHHCSRSQRCTLSLADFRTVARALPSRRTVQNCFGNRAAPVTAGCQRWLATHYSQHKNKRRSHASPIFCAIEPQLAVGSKPVGVRDPSTFGLSLQPQLYKPADGFGQRWHIGF